MDSPAFIESCQSLAVVAAEHAAQGEALRRVPDVVIDEIHRRNLMGAVVPRSLGGHGLSLSTLCEGTRELAKGCPATAWTASFLILHAWLLTKLPVQSHAELFSGEHMPTAAAPLTPSGRLTPVEGGYRVAGRWEWATGILHSQWCLVHGFDTSAEFATRFALVPVSSLTIEDVWHTSGMRATGSNVVVLDDVFVPAELTVDSTEMRERPSSVADDALGALPLASVLALVASAPAVGAAEAALEDYQQRMTKRVLAYTLGDKAADQPVAQARLGAIASEVAGMVASWRAAIAALEAVQGQPSDLVRVNSRLAAAAAVRQARHCIGAVGEGAGASVYASNQPFQRLQRDVETLKGHVMFDWDRTTELAGRVMLGQPLRPTDLA